MNNFELILETEQATVRMAQKLAVFLTPPLVLTLSGEIGAGKTTFVRALLHALGETSSVKSPTFSLIEHYSYQNFELYHMDLYRIQAEEELEYLGFREHFRVNTICCIEWPERVHPELIPTDLQFTFTSRSLGRHLLIQPRSSRGELLCCRLRETHNEAPFIL